MSLGRVVTVELPCGALVSVTVSAARGRCKVESCDHPTAEEAADLVRLAYLDAGLSGALVPRARAGPSASS